MSGLFGGGSTATAATPNALGTLEGDRQLSDPPSDSVSDIAFSPAQGMQNDVLAVASWDKMVRIYEVSADGSSQGKHMYKHEQPVLNCHFSRDGTKLASAGADKAVRMCDLTSQADSQVGAHDQPVRCVRWFESNGNAMVVSGSWDKTVRYWDLRSPTPAATLQCQERVYTMDVKGDLLVVGTADRYINVVDLKNPTKFYKTGQSTLKWQTRVVSCFADSAGYAVGSIEGRCAIQYVEDKDAGLNFSFKCHRDSPSAGSTQSTNVYAVNDISFHPVHGTFSTAGSDGTFHFWDKDAKHRLKGYPSVGGSITATDFNRTGGIFAYAVSYDWSKGFQGNSQSLATKVMLHPVNSEECKPRPAPRKK